MIQDIDIHQVIGYCLAAGSAAAGGKDGWSPLWREALHIAGGHGSIHKVRPVVGHPPLMLHGVRLHASRSPTRLFDVSRCGRAGTATSGLHSAARGRKAWCSGPPADLQPAKVTSLPTCNTVPRSSSGLASLSIHLTRPGSESDLCWNTRHPADGAGAFHAHAGVQCEPRRVSAGVRHGRAAAARPARPRCPPCCPADQHRRGPAGELSPTLQPCRKLCPLEQQGLFPGASFPLLALAWSWGVLQKG